MPSIVAEGGMCTVGGVPGGIEAAALSSRGKGNKVHSKVEVPPHLRLGLNYEAFVRFVKEELSKVGFKSDRWGNVEDVKEFRSEKYPESLFWIAEQYGDRPTGYDLAEATKMWLRMNNAEDKSVCEVLKERGWEGVGEAEVFLSHVQAESPMETRDAMSYIDRRAGPARRGTKHEGSKVWVDYFCLRQLQNDFQTKQVEQLIRKTGAVYVYMDGEETGSSYPTRSFCVFELAAAVENGATLMIKTPTSGPLQPPGCCCQGPLPPPRRVPRARAGCRARPIPYAPIRPTVA